MVCASDEKNLLVWHSIYLAEDLLQGASAALLLHSTLEEGFNFIYIDDTFIKVLYIFYSEYVIIDGYHHNIPVYLIILL